jgi:hypothetical protein
MILGWPETRNLPASVSQVLGFIFSRKGEYYLGQNTLNKHMQIIFHINSIVRQRKPLLGKSKQNGIKI